MNNRFRLKFVNHLRALSYHKFYFQTYLSFAYVFIDHMKACRFRNYFIVVWIQLKKDELRCKESQHSAHILIVELTSAEGRSKNSSDKNLPESS